MRESGAIVDLSKDGGPSFLVPFRSSFFWNKALEHRPRHYYYPGSAPAVRPTKMIAIDHDLPGSRDDSDFDGKKSALFPSVFLFQFVPGSSGGDRWNIGAGQDDSGDCSPCDHDFIPDLHACPFPRSSSQKILAFDSAFATRDQRSYPGPHRRPENACHDKG